MLLIILIATICVMHWKYQSIFYKKVPFLPWETSYYHDDLLMEEETKSLRGEMPGNCRIEPESGFILQIFSPFSIMCLSFPSLNY